MSNNGPQRGFDTYSPSMVNSFGFKPLESNALASVGFYLQIPVSYAFSYFSDYFDRRGESVITGLSCHMLGYIFNRAFTENQPRGVKYFGVVWTQTFGTFSHPLNITWLSLTCTDSEERALAMAMVIMGANIAGIYGAQIFRQEDRPKYRTGFSIGIGILAFAIVLSTVRYIDDLFRKRRNAQRAGSITNSSEDGNDIEKVVLPPADGQPAPVLIGADLKPVVSNQLVTASR